MERWRWRCTRALQFFFTSTPYNQVDQIVLAGGCALLPGLDELVAKRAGVATVVANPFATMQTSERIQPAPARAEAPMLMIAMRPGDAEVRITVMSHAHQPAAAPRAEAAGPPAAVRLARRLRSAVLGVAIVALVHGILARADRQPA